MSDGPRPGRAPETTAETTARAADLTHEVVASFDDAPERLGELMRSLVEHLHAFVTENDLTQEEWRAAIDFLTRAGHLTTDVRQEFILLSDTLGVSSLVDLLTTSRTPGSTPSAVLGPFYVEGPPEVARGSDIAAGLDGEPVRVELTISGPEGAPLPGAVVDVWQANREGFYDVQLPELDGPVLRARLRSDAEGRLDFWTILPAPYPIPDDGPVGRLLAATGRHPMRAPHLHVMARAPGHRTLVTQLFVEGGDFLDTDTVFGVKRELVVPFARQDTPPPQDAPRAAHESGTWRRLTFDLHLAAIPETEENR